jgi:glycerol-3-phosphate acyltransferase PlsX
MLDAGANADCRPEHLLEFGALGTAYARTILGIEEPRVGLLNSVKKKARERVGEGAYARLKTPASLRW